MFNFVNFYLKPSYTFSFYLLGDGNLYLFKDVIKLFSYAYACGCCEFFKECLYCWIKDDKNVKDTFYYCYCSVTFY